MSNSKCPFCKSQLGLFTFTTEHGKFCDEDCARAYKPPIKKIKHLIRKFGYKSIIEECKRQGWDLPYAKDLRGKNLEYDVVWVKNIPEHPKDRESHAMVYQHLTGRTFLCNKSFMMNIVVLKDK